MNTLQVQQLALTVGTFQLQDITLTIKSGEYHVLMGATGSGKSLFLKTICGFHKPDSGAIHLAGEDATDSPPAARHIGYVPQDSGLFPHLNVRENILFSLGRQASRGELPETLHAVLETLGVGHLLNRDCLHLSGGERQKVALARALCAEPRLLVLDEPVSALDEPTRREICALLLQVKEQFKVTTLHVCHNIDEAEFLADQVSIFAAGKLAQTGPLKKLRLHPENSEVKRILCL